MGKPRTSNDVYSTFGAMLRFIAATPACQAWLREIDSTWRFLVSDPEAEVTCAFLADGPLRVDFGASQLAAGVTISLTAAEANSYLLGELNGFLERDQGRLKIDGPPTAFLQSIPRTQGFITSLYREVLRSDAPPKWLRMPTDGQNR